MVKLRRINTNEEYLEDNKETITEAKTKVNEIDSQKIPFTNWKDPAMQAIICAEFDGMEVNEDKTTEETLIFNYEGYPCSLKFKGYMLSLDMDTSDDVPPAQFPVEDKPNLSVQSLIQTIKTVFKKRTAGTNIGTQESVNTDENKTEIKENCNMEESHPLDEKRLDEDIEAEDAPMVEAPMDTPMSVEDPSLIPDNEVLHDIAMERFLEDLSNSVLVSVDHDIVCDGDENGEDCGELIAVYLSPSYALNKASNILVPIFVKFNPELNQDMLSLPSIDSLPDPMSVFNNGDLPEDALNVYDATIQDYLLNDIGYSEVMDLNVDNTNEVKARVVDFLNNLAEDYQAKKNKLSEDMKLTGESIIKESRYFIVPDDTDLSSDVKVKKLTPLGYTDLNIAKSDVMDFLEKNTYPFGLKILDTNYSSNKEDWQLI